jgi:hypothetical protein
MPKIQNKLIRIPTQPQTKFQIVRGIDPNLVFALIGRRVGWVIQDLIFWCEAFQKVSDFSSLLSPLWLVQSYNQDSRIAALITLSNKVS